MVLNFDNLHHTRKIILACTLSFLFASVLAQKEAFKWYFGQGAGLDFSSGSPVVLTGGQIDTDEGCATINDKNGDLLFYTDGESIWNRNHQVMPNGTNLMGGYTSTQSAVAVPFPGNDSLYYVFTVSQEDRPHGFRCSVVNMKKDNGLGDVIEKNTLLLQPVYEKLSAVRHRNCSDYWIVTRKWDSDEFYAYHITSAGIGAPVISKTGNFVGGAPTNSRGQLKFSPDGTKAACAHNIKYDFVELMDFNNQTGVFTNTIKLTPNPPYTESFSIGAYGIEFSPNSKLLYVTSTYGFSTPQSMTLHQYNVSLGSAGAIINSKKLIDNSTFCYGMQLGPDMKVYVARYNSYIDVIANPDVEGPGCGYTKNAIFLGNASSMAGFPSFIQSFFKDPVIATGNCEFQNISFSIEGVYNIQSVQWDFGDPSSGPDNISTDAAPTHIYTQEGDYTVRLIISTNGNCLPDTFYKKIHAGPFKVFLGNDTTICNGDTLRLRAKIPNAFNLWNNGTTDTVLKVTAAGKYWVRVSMGNCIASDTVEVTVRNLPQFSLGKDTTICSNQAITLQPDRNYTGASYLWNDGTASSHLTTNTAGEYWLALKDSYGCTFRDSVKVHTSVLPNFSLGSDISVCENVQVHLSATVPGASYLWNTGVTTNQQQATAPGIYWLDATVNGCTYRDSVFVEFKPLPIVDLGEDTTLCEGNTLLLNAANPGATYEWQDKSAAQTLLATRQGTYLVKVTSRGCTTSDTIKIDYKLRPAFTLGADQLICDGMVIQLKPSAISGTIAWSDGSNSSFLPVTKPGLYYLSITNECGIASDSVVVSKGLCKLRVPNAFSPNNDRVNDVFRAIGDGITEFEMQVFNRWGQRIFHSNSITRGWDGKINGVNASGGTYVWIIRYRDPQTTKLTLIKGAVVLFR